MLILKKRRFRLACNNLQSIYLSASENINKNNVINSLGILSR